MNISSIVTAELDYIRKIFSAHGFNLWIVGGAPRDFIAGMPCNDIDLATDATPDEQLKIYQSSGIRYIPTGIDHGTYTVVSNNETYEITSLRIDTEQDGRHAKVEFTRDIEKDCARRDLTINSIAIDFHGNIIDPFGGVDDLNSGIVRFVGNAEDRITEDYLRILRYFRFYARYSKTKIDQDAMVGIVVNRSGLADISIERIWSEFKKIISGPEAANTISLMRDLGIINQIGIGDIDCIALEQGISCGITDPSSLLGLLCIDVDFVDNWKMSKEESSRVKFINEKVSVPVKQANIMGMLVDGVNPDWVSDIAKLYNRDMPSEVPTFPVKGSDLLEKGFAQGAQMGIILKSMMEQWKYSGYTMSKEELLRSLEKTTE